MACIVAGFGMAGSEYSSTIYSAFDEGKTQDMKSKSKKKKQRSNFLPLCITGGIFMGMGVGVYLSNPFIGMGLGAIVGAGLGYRLDKKSS